MLESPDAEKSGRTPRLVAKLLTPSQLKRMVDGLRMHLHLLINGCYEHEYAASVGGIFNIANALRGKMNADKFRGYLPGFICYKYLSEKIAKFGDSVLNADGLDSEGTDWVDKYPVSNSLQQAQGARR